MRHIDLNCDLGESFGRWSLGQDGVVIEWVSSANIACGFHAGDPRTMAESVAAAAARGIAIGAHVSYRDLHGFGRRFIDVDPEDLATDIHYQLGALDGFARAVGAAVNFVKPHGALYHALAQNSSQASAVLDAVLRYNRDLPVVTSPHSVLRTLAHGLGVRTISEGFPDRGYRADGSLVPRGAAGSLYRNPSEISERAVEMALRHGTLAIDGSWVPLEIDTLCIHGDADNAGEVARTVRTALDEAGVRVSPAAPPMKATIGAR